MVMCGCAEAHHHDDGPTPRPSADGVRGRTDELLRGTGPLLRWRKILVPNLVSSLGRTTLITIRRIRPSARRRGHRRRSGNPV